MLLGKPRRIVVPIASELVHQDVTPPLHEAPHPLTHEGEREILNADVLEVTELALYLHEEEVIPRLDHDLCLGPLYLEDDLQHGRGDHGADVGGGHLGEVLHGVGVLLRVGASRGEEGRVVLVGYEEVDWLPIGCEPFGLFYQEDSLPCNTRSALDCERIWNLFFLLTLFFVSSRF